MSEPLTKLAPARTRATRCGALIADAVAAGGVAASGGVILATGRLFWLDPAVALLIAVVVGYHAVQLLRAITAALRAHTSSSSIRR
jgi:divalent metal cation (Fe/Co/Zn/Cd) transporter